MPDPFRSSPAATLRRIARAALLCLLAGFGACATAGGAAGRFPSLAEYAGREVTEVEFVGNVQVSTDSLRLLTATRPTQCAVTLLPLSFCPGFIGRDRYRLDLSELARDLLRIQLYYRDQGFYGTRVVPSVDPREGDNVAVRFTIAPGEEVVLRQLSVEGAEDIIPPGEIEEDLPIEVGAPFGRAGFLASADTIRAVLFRRGHAYADVLRNYSIDTIADVAEAQFIAIPGPLVTVDSIRILGAERLGERTVRRQLTFSEGAILRRGELERSQRNLYALEFVNFASVEIAPDSLQVNPDSARATVVARIVEAPQYAVDASLGYGTIDCVRTGARWTNRNFLGGARRLELSGSLSKIGVGEPADWGFEGGPCRALADDRFSEELNYRVAAAFEQPQFFGTRNQLGIGLHAEQISELLTYQRESVGGQVSVTRGFRQALLSTSLEIERGSTQAPDAVFCIGFDLCSPSDVAELKDSRWSNSLAFGAVLDRTSTELFATRGFQLRAGATWASALLGSDDEYLRLTGEGAAYRELRPGWVLAGRLQAGTFLTGALNVRQGFIPPERRFYAGGPNSVRGFERNALGPRAYVLDTLVINAEGDTTNFDDADQSATGGTQLVVGSAELRIPSPILSQYLRFATFVDAGQVWAPGTNAADLRLRVTPGLGLRFTTPVGPIRADVAYNGYGKEAGPLYLVREDGNLVQIDPDFVPENGGFWSRLEFHFAVGQAF